MLLQSKAYVGRAKQTHVKTRSSYLYYGLLYFEVDEPVQHSILPKIFRKA